LSKVFVEFLKFCRSTRDFFKNHKEPRFVNRLKLGTKALSSGGWRKFKEEAETRINTIQYLCKRAKDEVRLAAINDAKKRGDTIGDILQEQNTERNHNEELKTFRNLCDWLVHVPTEEDFREIKKKQLPGSCTWVENDPTISSFLSLGVGSPRLLWITGRAGCGKTYVSAQLISVLEQQSYRTAYFFCKTQDEGKRTALGIFRTLAWQLLQTAPKKEATHYVNPLKRGESSTISHACSILKGLHDPACPTWLIIDGLDECSSEDQRDFLRECDILTYLYKVAIISRGTVEINNGLRAAVEGNISHFQITEEATKADIEGYLSQKVQGMSDQAPGLSPDLQEQITKTLSTGARGMFLWVHMMAEHLNELCLHGNDAAIIKDPQEYPRDIDEYYKRTLDNIEKMAPQLQETVLKVLKWIICGFRALTVTELDYAISIDVNERHYDAQKRNHNFRETLLEFCGSFIEIDSGSDTVNLTHASVKDFLLTQQTHIQLRMDLCSAHLYVAQACLSYLCHDGRSYVKICDADDHHVAYHKFEAHTNLEENQFLEYSSVHWYQHISYEGVLRDTECVVLFNRFASSEALLVKWLQLFCFFERRPGSGRTLGLILEALSSSTASPEGSMTALVQRTEYTLFRTHLGWAESGRFNRWQRMMAWRWDTLRDASVILVAAYFDFADIVEDEMTHGRAGVDSKNLHGLTPLILAARGGSVETVKRLIKHEASLDLQTVNLGHFALYEAVYNHDEEHWSRPGTYEVAHLLLKAGCAPNVRTWSGRNAIEGLLSSPKDDEGQRLITKALIQKGIEITAANEIAVQQNMPGVLQVMLDGVLAKYGADVVRFLLNSTTQTSTSLLQVGLKKQHRRVCQLLVRAGADVNVVAKKSQSPPLSTTILTMPDLVPLLLAHRANPMGPDAAGNRPLHLAAKKNLPKVIEALIAAGADIQTLNAEGKKPIELVSHSKSAESDVLRALLTPRPPSIARSVFLYTLSIIRKVSYNFFHLFKTILSLSWVQ